MQKLSAILGLIAGVTSLILWFVLNFANPYAAQTEFAPIMNTFLFLFLPACLAIYSSVWSKKVFMLIAFIWSVPLSLYLALTPGIFFLFGVTSITYLISYFLMRRDSVA